MADPIRDALDKLVALQKETNDGISWGSNPEAEKALRVRWSKAWTAARAALSAQPAPPKRTTGFIAPRDRYVPPVLFNPYTGDPRDVRDVLSDPQGILIVPPGAAMLTAKDTPT